MKTLLKVCLAGFIFLHAVNAQAAQAADILGIWKTAETEYGYSQVEIFQQNNKYHGRIIYLSMPNYTAKEQKQLKGEIIAGQPRRDYKNPDKNQQKNPIEGMLIVKNFVFSRNQWKQGRIYDPESGKTYKGKMWLNKNGTLGLRGYIGISVLGRSTVWERVNPLVSE